MMNFFPSLPRAWFAGTLAILSLGCAAAEDASVSVAKLVLTTSQSQQGTAATATVTVLDQAGTPVAGARVTGSWSGLTTSEGHALTNQKGRATFHSARSKDKGVFVFDLGTVDAMGASYNASSNVQSHDSIATLGIVDASHLTLGARP